MNKPVVPASSQKVIVMGRCGAPHGIKGMVKVFSNTNPLDNILHYQPWLIKHQGQWQPINIKAVDIHNQHIVVLFEGITDRNQAQQLTHAEIGVYREQLPELPEGQYYWADLEGLEVSNLEGFVFGNITHLMETGANDVIFIKGKQEFCLPYLMDRVIKKIDLKAGKMIVDWPSDL